MQRPETKKLNKCEKDIIREMVFSKLLKALALVHVGVTRYEVAKNILRRYIRKRKSKHVNLLMGE